MKMKEEIKSKVSEIDTEIIRHEWFDFHVLNFDGFKLTVAGSVDLVYYQKLEKIFEDKFIMSAFMVIY